LCPFSSLFLNKASPNFCLKWDTALFAKLKYQQEETGKQLFHQPSGNSQKLTSELKSEGERRLKIISRHVTLKLIDTHWITHPS
jgi:preprotein translocase subunit SecA